MDMNDGRQVLKERGEQLAIEYGIKLIEISAQASINVEQAFLTLARDINPKHTGLFATLFIPGVE